MVRLWEIADCLEATDAALEWFDGARDADAPFAMLVHYFDAHDPSLVPPRAFLEPRVGFELPSDLDERRHLAELFEGAEQSLRGWGVHKVEAQEVVDSQGLEHEDDVTCEEFFLRGPGREVEVER